MRYLIGLLLLMSAQFLFATHNRSGYIRYEQTGPLTIEAQIITFTRASSRPADRDTLTICWGDGICEQVVRANGQGTPPEGETLENDVKYNIYPAVHTYETAATYVVSMTDPNRDGGILNVNPPNSERIRFHLQATVRLMDTATMGSNKSPEILVPPVGLAYAGYVFKYNPNAVDADGDSIVYELTTPLEGVDERVPNFVLPNSIDSGGGNFFQVDPFTGTLTWDTPELIGKYNIAIRFKSYRDGELIDQFVLDMELLVVAETPPTNTEELDWAAQHIRVYPNPAAGRSVHIEYADWQRPVPYRIFNSLGQFVQEGRLKDKITRLEMPTVAAGTYTISYWNGKFWVPTKIQLL